VTRAFHHASLIRVGIPALVTIAFAAASGNVVAHGPDPLLGTTTWGRDQVVPFQWASTGTPPGWMAGAIDAGAHDVAESRGSRAALFSRASSAPATIAYAGPVPCDSYGIACMDRTGMTTGRFGMWFRPHGWAFDWGYLHWCQAMATPTNGCYDAENVALDEFGHVEILGHHVNFADDSDFGDAVVQTAARARPRAGWDQHVFGRCDVARLQLEYDRTGASAPVSTCLSLGTALGFSTSSTSVAYGASVQFTATLRIATTSLARAMSGDPLSYRNVVLQRRTPGTATWTSLAAMTQTGVAGTYTANVSQSVSYDWRAAFASPPNEGLAATFSSSVRVAVGQCTSGGCPLVAPRG
jgi:hypothetical protein